MEDFEIRQVFSIIKDRVNEIKKDQDWKQQIAEEWNNAPQEDEKAPEAPKSVYSYKSKAKSIAASQRSKMSMKSRVSEIK